MASPKKLCASVAELELNMDENTSPPAATCAGERVVMAVMEEVLGNRCVQARAHKEDNNVQGRAKSKQAQTTRKSKACSKRKRATTRKRENGTRDKEKGRKPWCRRFATD